ATCSASSWTALLSSKPSGWTSTNNSPACGRRWRNGNSSRSRRRRFRLSATVRSTHPWSRRCSPSSATSNYATAWCGRPRVPNCRWPPTDRNHGLVGDVMHGTNQPDNAQIRAELRQILADVIGGESADIDDDAPLLDYVTSSLALVAGIRVVYERFGVLLPIRPLLEGAGTLAALAAHIDQALSDRDRLRQQTNGGAAGAAEREWPQIPLAASHQHVGFLARYSTGSTPAYNEVLGPRLQG